MAKIERIFIEDYGYEKRLRIDWDNDRHQGIRMKDLSPESVRKALIEMQQFLLVESEEGKI